MNLCILDNDDLDPLVAPTYQSYGAMTERLLRAAGATDWTFTHFKTPQGDYPPSFDAFDAVLLTGSKADAFGPEPWVVELRERVDALLRQGTTLLGICFGHQLIAHCLGAPVGRAPQGWGVGRQSYQWDLAGLPIRETRSDWSLLASHQDQVMALPDGARLLAWNDHCPVAAYALRDQVLCVQGHPEFVPEYSAFLLDKRRERLGEPLYQRARGSLGQGHDGLEVARLMVAFVLARRASTSHRTDTAQRQVA